MNKCIIIANGESPDLRLIKKLRKLDYNFIICADGGANAARELNIIPDLIVGDFDSIKKKNLNFYIKKTHVLKIEDQNNTDVEKALNQAKIFGFEKVVLLGAIGDRLDHSYANICIAAKYYPDIKVGIIWGKSYLYIISGEENFKTKKGETISLFGVNPEAKFYSSGLRYALNGITLPMGVRESESNETISDIVSIKVENGKGLLFRELKMALKYDFI